MLPLAIATWSTDHVHQRDHINDAARLDLRQEFERIFADKRLAEIAMQAMPPIDYTQLATKRDLDALAAELRGEMSGLRGELRGEMAELRGEMSELRGEMSELRGDLKSDIANNLRIMLAAQLTTMVMLGAWVSAVT